MQFKAGWYVNTKTTSEQSFCFCTFFSNSALETECTLLISGFTFLLKYHLFSNHDSNSLNLLLYNYTYIVHLVHILCILDICHLLLCHRYNVSQSWDTNHQTLNLCQDHFISLKTTLSSVRLISQESNTNHSSKK